MFRQLSASAVLIFAACSSNPVPATPDDEQMSIGYGMQDRDNFAGSASSITSEEIRRMQYPRMEDLLRASVPGLQVIGTGPAMTLRIRGINSIYGSNEPLVVLDGVPLALGTAGGTLAAIPSQDVARIDVLKDAGSTAIYGSRGANGVILVTTRKR